jgi:hydroxymethylbilane synthase
VTGPADGRDTIRIATRGSRQATAQATTVAEAIGAGTGRRTELVFVETMGDRRLDVPLHTIGGQGVFIKEVQRAVLDGRADVAVHSAKDLPSSVADGMQIAAFCARRDPRDALVGASLGDLAIGATIATGSVRRRAQLAAIRPDLQFVELRGNIDARLSKVPAGGAVVMAVAALQILGLTDRVAEYLDVDRFVPAVGQGCVAVECRADDAATATAVAVVDDATTRRAVTIERAFLAELGSGCSLPVGGHVTGAELRVFLADPARGTARTEIVPLLGDDVADQQLARTVASQLQEAIG